MSVRRPVSATVSTIALLVILALHAAPAAAQTSLERSALARAVRQGHPVMIEVDAPGDSVIGQLRAVDDDGVEVALGSGVRRLSFAEVGRIYKEGDSVLNGAATGVLIFGGWCVLICGQALPGDDYIRAVVFNSLTGAGIGALIDSAARGTTTLYRRQSNIRVRGMVSPRSIGVGATMRW